MDGLNFPADKGTYILILHLSVSTRLTIGRFGTFDFPAGYYAYVGSAFGSGGLRGRLKHHLSLATKPHWHIDYLRQAATVCEVWWTVSKTPYEHQWSDALRTLPDAAVPAPCFGASDCRCPAHLIGFADKPDSAAFSDIAGCSDEIQTIAQQTGRRTQQMITVQHVHPGQVSQLFEVPELNYRIVSIEAGNSPGGAWLDNVQNSRTAFVWDGAHCLYFGGDADNEAFNHALTILLTGTLLPDVRQRGLSILKLHVTSEDWTPVLETAFESVQLQRRRRVLYGIQASADVKAPDILPDALPDGLFLRQIDRDLLQHAGLQNLDAMQAEIDSGWTSPGRFLSEGLGYCVIHKTDGIVAWITAEYVSEGVCGVGIETLETYQGRGLATVLASAFVREASARRLSVWWDSWLTNTPSVRVAEKTGFQKVREYDAWLVIPAGN